MDKRTGYQEDLAYIHDAGFVRVAQHAAAYLLKTLRQDGIRQGQVVDLGCGSGVLSAELAAAGYAVLGVDYSAALLKIARQRVPNARFQKASFLDVDLPPCVAVAAIGEIFNYLFDENNNRKALARFFARVFDALEPGCLFLFDIAAPGRAGGPGPQHRNAQGEDWATLVTTEEDAETWTLTRHITSFRRVGKMYRRAEEVHRLQLYPARDLVAELRRLGFRAKRLRGYGDFCLPKGWTPIAARKPLVAKHRHVAK